MLAQTLASRAYRALNRVCVGEARRVRFKSRGRGLSSLENKRNDTGLRFMLQKPEQGNRGFLIWKEDQLEAVIDWEDEVVAHGLEMCRIKYARLVQRRASSERAAGADAAGFRYAVQLALEGVPHRKAKHAVGHEIFGADLGPSTIALVPQAGEASFSFFCEELTPDEQAIRQLQRQMDRQRRAANPQHYVERGRSKKLGKNQLHWKTSKSYERTRRRKATRERKLAAHRKSLHGRKVHEIVSVGNTVILERISYKAWQKQYGKSVGLRAPGMFVDMLRRTVARTGGTLLARSHAHRQTLAVLSWLRPCREETAVAALASLSLRHRPRAAGPLCGVSGLHALSRPLDPVMRPECDPLGKCGGALAGRACTGAPTGE